MADQVTPPSPDGYLRSLNRAEDLVLKAMYEEACADNVPVVGPEVGALLQVLVMATRATRVLEIGAATGYSGVWLARTLPADGLLLTIEIDPARASLARENFKRAGVAERANVIVGDAMRFVAKVGGPFDLIFNDTDKQLYGALHDRLVDLLRPGGLLVVDDTLLYREDEGRDPARAQKSETMARYNERLASDERLVSTVLPLGDGVTIAVKR